MSVIDSGLGWKCDSDYFVNEADAELAIVSTDTAIKALQGAAITAQITNGNSTQLFLISTVENNAKLKMNSSLRTVYSVSVGGETWYISLSYMSSSVTSDYPLITASKGESLNDTTTENLAKIIAEITEAADVVFAKKVPTVDYIHQYVEGVEAETVNRVNAVKNMITPVFNAQTVYAVGDYCIYNNGLYKCTTAHSGAWSASHFTSVSVMNEIKNASGGGLVDKTHAIVFLSSVYDSKTVTFPVLPGAMTDNNNVFVAWAVVMAYPSSSLTNITQPAYSAGQFSNAEWIDNYKLISHDGSTTYPGLILNTTNMDRTTGAYNRDVLLFKPKIKNNNNASRDTLSISLERNNRTFTFKVHSYFTAADTCKVIIDMYALFP